MEQHRVKTVGVAIVSAAIVCWSGPAFGDPITAVFDVQMINRIHPRQAGTPGEPWTQAFTLYMTFDPDRSPNSNTYGPAKFSEIPLPRPAPLSTPPHLSATSTFHAYDYQPTPEDQLLELYAVAHFFEDTFELGTGTYTRSFGLRNWQEQVNARPPLTGEMFPLHLAEGDNPINFNFTVLKSLAGTYTDDSFFYYGQATLREVQTPVPEPATLALVGTGLAMLARRRHKRR
jgi:hypothetical protein